MIGVPEHASHGLRENESLALQTDLVERSIGRERENPLPDHDVAKDGSPVVVSGAVRCVLHGSPSREDDLLVRRRSDHLVPKMLIPRKSSRETDGRHLGESLWGQGTTHFPRFLTRPGQSPELLQPLHVVREIRRRSMTRRREDVCDIIPRADPCVEEERRGRACVESRAFEGEHRPPGLTWERANVDPVVVCDLVSLSHFYFVEG